MVIWEPIWLPCFKCRNLITLFHQSQFDYVILCITLFRTFRRFDDQIQINTKMSTSFNRLISIRELIFIRHSFDWFFFWSDCHKNHLRPIGLIDRRNEAHWLNYNSRLSMEQQFHFDKFEMFFSSNKWAKICSKELAKKKHFFRRESSWSFETMSAPKLWRKEKEREKSLWNHRWEKLN